MARPSSKLRVLSYNIHQGLTVYRRQITLSALREAIESLRVDVVLLQEVAGVGAASRAKTGREIVTPFQLEALADGMWPYSAYGRNSIFSGGFHGNAILSRFPIVRYQNTDISLVKGLVRRGVLHAQVEISGKPIHFVSTHLGLLEVERARQARLLVDYVKGATKTKEPVIIGGDFNDWRERLSPKIRRGLKMEEAFQKLEGKHARSFPARFPVLRLDRIYYRGLRLRDAVRVKGRPWQLLSDHLPLIAEFTLSW